MLSGWDSDNPAATWGGLLGFMAEKGVFIVDRVVQEEMGGGVDLLNNQWLIPRATPGNKEH